MQDNRSKIWILLASVVGTALEFYGFCLYIIFGNVIAEQFFPLPSKTASLLSVYAIFAASFLMRPLGAAIFGYISDTYGRKQALSISIILMGLSLFVIGVLPNYKMIGVLAPISIILCRCTQSACAGGEYNNAGIFIIEHLKKRTAFAGSLVCLGGGVGALMATAVKYITLQPQLPQWSWRISFILGAIIALAGIKLRALLHEHPFKTQNSFRFKNVILDYKLSSLCAFSIGAIDGALAYILTGFMYTFLCTHINLTPNDSALICLIAQTTYIIFTPLMGYLADTVGYRLFFSAFLVLALPLNFIVFKLIGLRVWNYALLGEILFTLIFAAMSAAQHPYLLSLFPAQLRGRGIGINFSLGGALFGGGAPFILTTLLGIFPNRMIPAYFLLCIIAFCFFCVAMQQYYCRKDGIY